MASPRKKAVKRAEKPNERSKSKPKGGADSASDGGTPKGHNAQQFTQNMLTASQLWQQVLQQSSLGFMKNPAISVGHSDPLQIGDSFMKLVSKLASNPSAVVESQMELWREHMQLWHRSTESLLGKSPFDPKEVSDRRFKDEAWTDSGYFDYLRRSYLLNSEWVQQFIGNVNGLDAHTARKVEFFTRQFFDALSPSNFLLTNPEVMKLTLESNGENLVRGLTQLLEDVERGGGKLRISMTDEQAFELGKNIAMSKGQVVYENDLMQLIQYAPTTPKVFEVPILITPAWINKYYVLDLQDKNSLVKWLTDQGYTVFIISWVNPDASLAGKRFDDYLAEGPLAALDVIETITGCKQTSMISYCLGGTLSAVMLSYLRAKKQEKRVASITYLTTMVDFSDAGELAVFIDDEQLERLEGRMKGKGYLEAADMANTFNLLRSKDLIWSFVINNYLLGKEPFPFDLLYWNSDATRMPAAMHSFYLRNMYQRNLLAQPGGIEALGEPVHLNKISTPTYMLSTKDDHIAPWEATYLGAHIYDADVTFVLSQSGHIAGVVNPPSKGKYGYWVQEKGDLPLRASDWFAGAAFNEGQSWWPHWHEWHKQFAGKKVAPPALGGKHYPPLEAAPGAYARMKA